MTHYAIRGGREGYDRLRVLARARWPDTSAFLARVGVERGMRCVDVGCGGGEVTFELARLVGPDGAVVGLDMDEVKLTLARKVAAELDLANVEFRAVDVNHWDEPDAYDLVFSRFLLQHLAEPVDLLRRLWAAVREGGALAVEDADFDGLFCDPPNDGFEFFAETYARVLERRGGDATTGRKLPRHFASAGIPAPELTVTQAVYRDGEGKTLALSTLEATAAAIRDEGIAGDREIAAAIASLAAHTEAVGTLNAEPRVFQVCSRRPGSGSW